MSRTERVGLAVLVMLAVAFAAAVLALVLVLSGWDAGLAHHGAVLIEVASE